MKSVSILAISMYNQEETKSLLTIENNLRGGEDIVLLPESFIDTEAYGLDDPFLKEIMKLAHKGNTHILCPLIRKISDTEFATSAIWINRQGGILFTYDKVFPYWGEFPGYGGKFNTVPGSQAYVCETDFGRVSTAICFDANFPELWRDIADKNADIVFFASAYSAGQQLAAHALNHHYTIVSCTRFPDFAVIDPAGREIQYNKGVTRDDTEEVLITRASVDLDKVICHHNFNEEKIQLMLAENPGTIEIENDYKREEWIVLRSFSNEINVRDLCRKYRIENLRDYQNRSRAFINSRRKDPSALGRLT